MKCTVHDREPCLEPRCHVLAVCLAEIPTACDRDSAEWSLRHGYKWRPPNRCTYDDTRVALAGQIAARLVAWMRWPGVCAADELWDNFRKSYRHPLDKVMPYAARVAALASECPFPKHGTDNFGRAAPLGAPVPCDYDGINWATVAVLLDWMGENGIPLDVVHEWRPAFLAEALSTATLALPGVLPSDGADLDELRFRIQTQAGLSDAEMSCVATGIAAVAAASPDRSLRECYFDALMDAQRLGRRGLLWWMAQGA